MKIPSLASVVNRGDGLAAPSLSALIKSKEFGLATPQNEGGGIEVDWSSNPLE